MTTVEIRVPQLGEGLQEARIVRFLKQPGEPVGRDEPIFEMETDKALMEIEAPAAGTLVEWLVSEDDLVPIGAVVGAIEPAAAIAAPVPLDGVGPPLAAETDGATVRRSEPPRRPPSGNAAVPPRTRAYASNLGVSEDDLAAIAAAAGGRALPKHVDAWLAERSRTLAPRPAAPARREPELLDYEDIPLPQHQRTVIYHFHQGTRETIPAAIEMRVVWDPIEAVRRRAMELSGGLWGVEPSQFLLFSWCVVRVAVEHPRILCAMLDGTTLRQYKHLHLGYAVARPGDELYIARVPNADTLPFPEFVRASQNAVRRAREGEDQGSQAMQLTLTNLRHADVRTGIPVVTAPAVGTVFVGAPFDEAYPLAAGGIGFRRMACIVLSFDHRIVNGLGAAGFLADVKRRAEAMREEFRGFF
ncbi:MAG TPA: 2-oxo acid dehydrogenase subunit E2 [Chthonomonadales bacterium]|nr:2-oxo acid dehydrogenase subunit E2 [Chthonomonadales bacterium]